MVYIPEKYIWTETDFDTMGWHDNHVYKIRLNKDLEMDIDYIFKWNQPDVEGLPFTFWISPATLVFKNITNANFDLDTSFTEGIEIDFIEREKPNKWTIVTQQGDIQFIADSFEQFIRQAPSFQFSQIMFFSERQGYSLERVTDQPNPYLLRPDYIEKRKKDFEDYENAKKRQQAKHELNELIKARENNEIDTKAYLAKKKEINGLLFSHNFFLKGTRFEDW